jgi:hypothetical protein
MIYLPKTKFLAVQSFWGSKGLFSKSSLAGAGRSPANSMFLKGVWGKLFSKSFP